MGRKTTKKKQKKTAEKKAAEKQAAADAADPFRPSTGSEAKLQEQARQDTTHMVQQQAQQTIVVPPRYTPTAKHLLKLPYIATLCPQHEDLHALLLQEHRTSISVAKCKALVKQVKDAKGKTEYDLAEPRQQLAIAQRAADEVEARVTRAIDKHYRVSSIKLHPDRVGEQARPAFEALTEARNCLRVPASRRLYIDQMLDVVTDLRFYEPGAKQKGWDVQHSHKSWVERNPPSKFMEKEGKEALDGRGEPGSTQKPLALMGGIINDTPRKPRVTILSNEARTIKVSMPLPADQYQFLAYCESVVVVADNASISDLEILGTINMDQPDAVSCGTIEGKFTIPSEGIWYVKWYAHLVIDGLTKETPHSYETTVDVTSRETIKIQKEVVELCELVRHRVRDIKKALHEVSSLPATSRSRSDLENKYWQLHSVLAKARSTQSRLKRLIEAHGQVVESSETISVLSQLDAILVEAKPVKKELDAALSSVQKRDALQDFKAKIAEIIEEGNGVSFVESATPTKLRQMGGEPNRLYQLLVEGKGKQYGALELDSDILAAASKRNDMYSAKQMKALDERRADAEEASKAEQERNRAEAAEKAKYENERKAAEERAAKRKQFEANERKAFEENAAKLADERRGLSAGSVVTIQGLKSAQVQYLNGTTATIKGRASEFGDSSGQDRYFVICHEDGKEKSIMAKNLASLTKIDEDDDPAVQHHEAQQIASGEWTCGVCTYLHKGKLVHRDSCEMCDTPRGKMSPRAPNSVVGRAPAAARPHTSSTMAPAQTRAPPAKAAQPLKTIPKIVVKAPAPRSKAKSHTAGGTVLVGAPSARSGRSGASSKKEKKPRPCRDGAKCRFLPDKCNFHHTPEEIEAARNRPKKRNFIQKTALISPTVVGAVIGHGGTNIQKIHRDTKCNIWIDQESMPAHEKRIVDVSGHPEMVNLALEMIKDLVFEFGHDDDFEMKKEEPPRLREEKKITPVKSTSAPSSNTPTVASTPAPASSNTSTPISASPPAMAPALVVPARAVSNPVVASPTAVRPTVTLPTSPLDNVPARVEVNTDIQSVVSEPSVATMLPNHFQQQPQQQQSALGLATQVSNQSYNPDTIGGIPLAPVGGTGANESSELQRLLGSSLLADGPVGMQGAPLQEAPGRGLLQGLQQYQQPFQANGLSHVAPASSSVAPMMARSMAPSVPPSTASAASASRSGQGQDSLLRFLEANQGCLKGSPGDFCRWLGTTEDIRSLADLGDAVEDDDYLQSVLQIGNGTVGVKGFKRNAFKKAVQEAVENARAAVPSTSFVGAAIETGTVVSGGGVSQGGSAVGSNEPPPELVCPISHQLMVNSPVIASDGYSYERAAIEQWIHRKSAEIQKAHQILQTDPTNNTARAIAQGGVLSPMTGEPLSNMALLPNITIRNMALDAARQGY